MLGQPLFLETTILHFGHCCHFFFPASRISLLSSSAAPWSDEQAPAWAWRLHRTHVSDRHRGQVPAEPAREARGTKAAHCGTQQ